MAKAARTPARVPPLAPEVAQALRPKTPAAREGLLALRQLIYETAATTHGVGPLVETLKWGQPSYLTAESGSGTTVRIDTVRGDPDKIAVFVHCQTDLVARFRDLYPALDYEGTRAVHFAAGKPLLDRAVRHIFALALTYHQRKGSTD